APVVSLYLNLEHQGQAGAPRSQVLGPKSCRARVRPGCTGPPFLPAKRGRMTAQPRVPIDRLRTDVRVLGVLLGDVLREQGGQQLFELVELLRTQAIARRVAPSPEGDAALQR